MEDFISRRLLDLAQQSDRTARFTFSDFLTEAEFAAFSAIRSQLPDVGWTAFGGYPQADRVMLRFGNPELLGYEEPFPIVCIQIAPVQEKFAENLSHRDFLGAVMHLGIQRSGVGDILVQEKHAYLFCRDALADYICGSLERIRHTSVRCTVTESLPDLEALTAKNPLLADFAAVQSGELYCTKENFYQASMELGDLALDLHRALTGETEHYVKELALLNRKLAGRADLVVEVVCGLPNLLKGDLPWMS